MSIRHEEGFEGDRTDFVTIRSHGQVATLQIYTHTGTSGRPAKTRPRWYFTASKPGEGIVMRKWRCSEVDGEDYSAKENARCWRLVVFPAGYGEYEDVPESLALHLDSVLDTLCCREPK